MKGGGGRHESVGVVHGDGQLDSSPRLSLKEATESQEISSMNSLVDKDGQNITKHGRKDP